MAPRDRNRLRGECRSCGRRMQSRGGAFLCAVCREAARATAGEELEANWQERPCEWCARVHRNRWVCLDRAERAAETVRLWMLERGYL